MAYRASTHSMPGAESPNETPIATPGGLTPMYQSRNGSSAALSVYSQSHRDTQFIHDIRHDIIINHLYEKQVGQRWIQDFSGTVEGVLLKKARGEYITFPEQLVESTLAQSIATLNVQAALTVRTKVVATFIARSTDAEIPIRKGLRVQVIPTIEELVYARKHQYAAFVASESMLIVWDDNPDNLAARAESIQEDLLKSAMSSYEAGFGEKGGIVEEAEIDVEAATEKERPVVYYNSICTALSLTILVCLSGLGWQSIATEVSLLKTYMSILLVLMTPIQWFMALFFTNVIVSIFARILGPVSYIEQNSKFYSAKCSPRIEKPINGSLPHVTIQCPVYKEGLDSVIAPTVRSIKKAISTYELQGGTANILMHDDGIQIIDEEERQARIDFYTDHNIGWTARPKHGDNGFVRRGKFKKASNMNFGLRLSNLVEKRLQAIPRGDYWTSRDENGAYDLCLAQVLEEEKIAWAAGNIRVGDYIIIIDSDTEVPEDCILDAVSEMEHSPDVAIIQFASGVMQVSWDFFENGITFFTNLIYSAICFGVSSGDVAPFVGHNAILRWSAVQQVSFIDDQGEERFWSETSVSEDFDMALRLQIEGYVVRLAAWADGGFKEGVSLTVYDELARWEKYAYGCNELVFNPAYQWIYRGPFTPLFRTFVGSSMPLASKLNIVSYIGTYYAIGAVWVFTFTNYVVVGLYNGYYSKWYNESWKIWLSVVVVFTLGGNIALAVERYRLGQKGLLSALFENFKWCFMFVVFFGGISFHVSQALLCHMFSIDMQWGATAKEVERSNFFLEVPKIAKRFKWSMLFCLATIAGMVIMAKAPFIPWSWNIDKFVAIFPMAVMVGSHMLLPIVLNPSLMAFTF
ncbi:Glycosyl transferase family 2 [Neofusicoccum parvum]|uniref:Glycosyl transferase family 2 n=1 Tax=Neofusicoccum parvum TaxID=310453 RepID=A0ACB5S6R3_9PEZI|nr:Glycosyl transferase family 2 [Neofusicoccum parvum]GME32989.1 Glycosyl transferase family 2 [Neofusicoccum parvum]